jgi:hypothetical protein
VTIPPTGAGAANLVLNPSAEVNLDNIIAASGQPALQRVATGAVDGAWAVQVTCDLASGFQGVTYTTEAGMGFTGTARTYVGSVYLSGDGTVSNILTRIYYTDGSFTNSTVRSNTVLSATPTRYANAAVTSDPAKTMNFIRLMVYQPSSPTTPITYYADAAQIEEGTIATPYGATGSPGFHRIGDTHIGPLRAGKA